MIAAPVVSRADARSPANRDASHATNLYMTTLSTTDARASFSKLIESASRTHERFEVTRNGTRAAVILGADDYDAMVETVEVLSDPEAVQAVQEALLEFDRGDIVSSELMRDRLRAAGRIRT